MTPEFAAKILAGLITGGIASLILTPLMMLGTQIYLNRTTHRQRLIELVWGKDNNWYRGQNFDFVMANFVFSGSTFAAWRLKAGLLTKSQRKSGSYAYPNLHNNNNYNKLLSEFPFFVRWEFTKAGLIIYSLGSALLLSLL
jgi:hypothetical protein